MTSTEPITVTIVEHIAAKKSIPAESLEPLYEAVDPDALERLVTAEESTATPMMGKIVFNYSGYEVTVTSDGNVSSTPLENR